MTEEIKPLTTRERAIGYLMVLLTPLCRYPQELKIQDSVDERGLILNVVTGKFDGSIVIGRFGMIADSIRNIMSAWGGVHNAKISVFVNRRENLDNISQEELEQLGQRQKRNTISKLERKLTILKYVPT